MGRSEFQARFFAEQGQGWQWCQLFNHLPNVSFYIKSADSRLVAANNVVIQRLGLTCESDLIGRCDADFFPDSIAEGYVRDDRMVLSSRLPLINRLEVWKSESIHLEWCLTSKFPLFNKCGEPCGIAGITRPCEKKIEGLNYSLVTSEIIQRIESGLEKKFSLAELAKEMGRPARFLQDAFLKDVGISIRAYYNQTRVISAAYMLRESDATILEIANKLGFHDRTGLTRAFQKEMGCSPGQFRRDSRSLV